METKFTSLKQAAQEFCISMPKVIYALKEVGILGPDGMPRLILFESGDAQPRTRPDGGPRFVLETKMVEGALNHAGFWEPSALVKKCFIRHRQDALAVLNRGVCAIGASIGFDINLYPKPLGAEDAWVAVSQLLPTELVRQMTEERNAQQPIHGLSVEAMDTMVYAHRGDPTGCRWGWLQEPLTTRENRGEAVEAMNTTLSELIATANGLLPEMAAARSQELGEGLAMLEAVKSWIMLNRSLVG